MDNLDINLSAQMQTSLLTDRKAFFADAPDQAENADEGNDDIVASSDSDVSLSDPITYPDDMPDSVENDTNIAGDLARNECVNDNYLPNAGMNKESQLSHQYENGIGMPHSTATAKSGAARTRHMAKSAAPFAGIGSQLDEGDSLGDDIVMEDGMPRYLAMNSASVVYLNGPQKTGRQSTITRPKPKSRSECERQCGVDGFCDPSDLTGCRGLYCGETL